MSKRLIIIFALGAIACFAAWKWQSGRGLVTLEVRNAPLRDIIKSLERQTGRRILSHQNLTANLTLSIRRKPLTEALSAIAEQCGATWAYVLPVYSSAASLNGLEHLIRGESPAAAPWTDFQKIFSPGRRIVFLPETEFPDRAENISLDLRQKDAATAAAALSNLGQAYVITEDNLRTPVTLQLKDATLPKSVAQLAAQTGKQWAQFYTLQERPRVSVRMSSREDAPDERAIHHVGPDKPGTGEGRLVRRGPSPEEEERMNALRNMTPAERESHFAAELRGRAAQRVLNGLRNHTPEQRVDKLRAGPSRDEQIEIHR